MVYFDALDFPNRSYTFELSEDEILVVLSHLKTTSLIPGKNMSPHSFRTTYVPLGLRW